MDWTQVMLWISTFVVFATTGLPVITEFIYQQIAEPQTKFWKSFWSWLIPIILMYAVWLVGIWFEIGFLTDVTLWWVPAVYGATAGAFSNFSWMNIPWVKEFVLRLLSELPRGKEFKEV